MLRHRFMTTSWQNVIEGNNRCFFVKIIRNTLRRHNVEFFNVKQVEFTVTNAP